jgi:hypothetical protein
LLIFICLKAVFSELKKEKFLLYLYLTQVAWSKIGPFAFNLSFELRKIKTKITHLLKKVFQKEAKNKKRTP